MPRYASEERQQAEEARHRREILVAAAQALLEKGLSATTMQDVAREAHFSVGKIYSHFPTKAALLQELFELHLDELLELVEASLPTGGRPVEVIESCIERIMRYTLDNPVFFRLINSETLGFEFRWGASFGEVVESKYERMLEAVRVVFGEGLEKGVFVGGTAAELSLKLAGIFNAVLAAELRKERPQSVAEVSEVVTRLFWGGVLADPKTQSRARMPRDCARATGGSDASKEAKG